MEAPRFAGHIRLASISLVAAVLLPLFFSLSEASWPDDPTVNLPVCVTAQMQSRPVAISDGAGGIIVVWQDYRNLYFDIYAQRIAFDGTVMWGVNGVSVCGAAGEQEFPEVVPDGAGGAIIVWEDRRLPTEQNLFAQSDDDRIGQDPAFRGEKKSWKRSIASDRRKVSGHETTQHLKHLLPAHVKHQARRILIRTHI